LAQTRPIPAGRFSFHRPDIPVTCWGHTKQLCIYQNQYHQHSNGVNGACCILATKQKSSPRSSSHSVFPVCVSKPSRRLQNLQSPRELIFQIGFLGLEALAKKANLLKVEIPSNNSGKSPLGPFLKLADLESTRLTLIANGVSISKAHTDPRSRETSFPCSKKTRKLDILAVAPQIANGAWTFIWGDADAPIKRAQVFTPLAGNLQGTQAVAFRQAGNSRSISKLSDATKTQPQDQDQDLSAIVTLTSQIDNGT